MILKQNKIPYLSDGTSPLKNVTLDIKAAANSSAFTANKIAAETKKSNIKITSNVHH